MLLTGIRSLIYKALHSHVIHIFKKATQNDLCFWLRQIVSYADREEWFHLSTALNLFICHFIF